MLVRLATLPLFLVVLVVSSMQAQKASAPAKIDWTDSSDVFDMDTPTWMTFSQVKPQMELWGGPTSMRRNGTAPLEDNLSFGLTLGTVRTREHPEKTVFSSHDGIFLRYAMSKDQPQPPLTQTADI